MSIPTLFSIQNILFNENDCIKFLFDNNILYNITECKKCMSKVYRDNKRFRCCNKKCRKSESIFKDSFFAQNHISCNHVLLISYLWLCKSSRDTILFMTGHSPNTVTNFLNYLRELIISTLEDEVTKIGGDNIIVEIDESKFGRRKYHRGRRVEGVWVSKYKILK